MMDADTLAALAPNSPKPQQTRHHRARLWDARDARGRLTGPTADIAVQRIAGELDGVEQVHYLGRIRLRLGLQLS